MPKHSNPEGKHSSTDLQGGWGGRRTPSSRYGKRDKSPPLPRTEIMCPVHCAVITLTELARTFITAACGNEQLSWQ